MFILSLENFTTSTFQEDLEASEEGNGTKSYRSSLSLEIYGLRREQQVYFSNQEYYTRLEELKRTHLRNMADLEKMYISHERVLEEGHSRGDDREDGLTIRLDFLDRNGKQTLSALLFCLLLNVSRKIFAVWGLPESCRGSILRRSWIYMRRQAVRTIPSSTV